MPPCSFPRTAWRYRSSNKYRRFISINGRPTVEVDFSEMHPSMLYILDCRRRSKSEPPRRPKIGPGVEADFELVGCG